MRKGSKLVYITWIYIAVIWMYAAHVLVCFNVHLIALLKAVELFTPKKNKKTRRCKNPPLLCVKCVWVTTSHDTTRQDTTPLVRYPHAYGLRMRESGTSADDLCTVVIRWALSDVTVYTVGSCGVTVMLCEYGWVYSGVFSEWIMRLPWASYLKPSLTEPKTYPIRSD